MDTIKRRPTAILEDQQADTTYAMDTSDQGLHAQFYRSRVVGGAVAVAAITGTIMLLLLLQGDGVRIESFLKDDKDDDEIKNLLDSYNSISGYIGSFITKPVEFFLGVLVSVSFLCLATDFTLSKSNDGHWKYVPMLAGAAIAYAFSNGLNALNVQVVSGKVNVYMGVRDLLADGKLSNGSIVENDASQVSANGSLVIPWKSTFAETKSANDVLNTILRSMINPIENTYSMCEGTGYKDVREPFSASTIGTFGFPARKWHNEVLPKGGKPLKIAMNARVSDLPSDSALPSTASISRGLVNVDVRVMNDLFRGTNQTINPTVPTTGTFVNASHATWPSVLNVTKGAMPNEATVEYSRFEFSDKLTYDAVTLEIPVVMVQRDKVGSVGREPCERLARADREGLL